MFIFCNICCILRYYLFKFLYIFEVKGKKNAFVGFSFLPFDICSAGGIGRGLCSQLGDLMMMPFYFGLAIGMLSGFFCHFDGPWVFGFRFPFILWSSRFDIIFSLHG